ncbi:hypothetical protein MIND_01316000 [Mycena indigotica]|uniref:SigF-like NTF2-like domain-containing protein n=1 Tax=Mycena indigotica TaxID=2126181 RepID=A0A8H6S1T0_9AGAR|nr:uncharacterized protein MIND_01316000 [Mycena indigotica]KAF7290753.1 hypothetical protein MIND_01316000 [Mycena indigotica]
MQNPTSEIGAVVSLLTAAAAPDIQKAAFLRYMTSDAGFRHPLCSVLPGPGSRERVLGIYQWYRIMSPRIDITVNNVVYDETNRILLLDVVQLFHIRFSPFKPAPARLLVRLTLRQDHDGLFYIALQEDFYHPDDFMALLAPPLSPLVRLGLSMTGRASDIYAKCGRLLGIWTSETGVAHGGGLYDDEDKKTQ